MKISKKLRKNIYFGISNSKKINFGLKLDIPDGEFGEKFFQDGLVVISQKCIHEFCKFGIYLRKIELPFDDWDFEMHPGWVEDTFKVNKIILKEKYSSDDPETYRKLNIKYPSLGHALSYDLSNVVKYLIENKNKIHTNNDFALRWAAANGHLETVMYLVEKGANIHACNDEAVQKAVEYGHLDIVKYLVEKRADFHARNERALGLAAKKGHLEIVKYLVEIGANIHANDEHAFKVAVKKEYSAIVEYFAEKGINIEKYTEFLSKMYLINNAEKKPLTKKPLTKIYFKVTNAEENHHGFQYMDGLNVLDKEFDYNRKNTCSAGGLYFADNKNIHDFYNYGIYLRIVELPVDDPDFKMLHVDGKFRANKIILKEKYRLDDPETYKKFGIKFPYNFFKN
ncbi:MAG: putative ankyrin repeat protein [Satyrvirus sp.]|uniref:Putative ankyrin repeat protein n=1 Tax=Satyrvirus sp. TaxID=2487771 RepID=A0A3G5AGI9_9VIRU|nr:MAG: putative ankyrin repeat protein [Satyrvirus sp.]